MDNFPPEAWQRLGKALERRRGQLGYGFRRRGEFAQGSGLSAKTLARLEHAERDSYPDDTIALAEVIYKWEPGSAEAVLKGGEPVPSPGSPGATERPEYDDPDLQEIWELKRLPENVRLGMIALARGMREAEEHENGEERPA
jgi:hypothetical protein